MRNDGYCSEKLYWDVWTMEWTFIVSAKEDDLLKKNLFTLIGG